MKFNRVLSTVIIFVMLFTSMVAVFPVGALASEGDASTVTVKMVDESNVKTDEASVLEIINNALLYKFNTAEEMLNHELELGYLASCATEKYTVYVNIYTGFVYYKNNVTGQILTSNPTDPGYILDAATKEKLMSQVELTYKNKDDNSSEKTFTSMQWLKQKSFLTVKEIPGKGISVTYTLGEANTNFIAPSAVIYETFMSDIATPMFDKFEALLADACGPFNQANVDAVLRDLNNTTYSNHKSFASYNVADKANTDAHDKAGLLKVTGVQGLVTAMSAYADKVATDPVKKAAAVDYANSITAIFTNYNVVDKAKYPANLSPLAAVEDGKTVFLMKDATNLTTKQIINKAFRTLLPEYTLEKVQEHEEACGYESKDIVTPTFTCDINYTLDGNGILGVEIPVNPEFFTFRASDFSLTSFTPLKYFGAGNMDNDGYIFYPDGSGAIVEFDDFYHGSKSGKVNTNIAVSGEAYGNDYVYSEITGAHREQITMPVMGIVNDVDVNASTAAFTAKSQVTNGFFTIVEEGSAISTLGFVTESSAHKYASAYAKIKPYPADKIDLSETISVSANNFYYKISDMGYQGSCRLKINMLADEELAATTGFASDKTFYPADYAGMAECYREYLSENGVLSDLTELSADLPLYIEALGSIDITKRILTFPVTASTALTSFADIKNIYDDLADVTDSIAEFKAEAERYRALADEKAAEEDLNENEEILISDYRAKAARYDELALKIQNIRNINFKLTGFANGGMYFTYPAKVKWEKSVGGKRGFRELLAYSKEVGNREGSSLGIYPDFDFLFINNTSSFDKISPKKTAARMIDNRYASKQSYNSIQQEYESLFALVISTDSLDKLYSKFNKKFSKFDSEGLSVSSLGSILNSNMDEDNTINREDSLNAVSALLDRMTKADGDNYSLMTEIGNIYSIKYVDHILNGSTDSSHFRYSSYTIPFYGMVLHGSVNYTGAPINYSGASDYDILRSIESGASLYYVLCCSNTNYLKEDKLLSDYYGIDYANWEEKILEQYAVLNGAIGDLQKYKITDHEILVVERVIDNGELYQNFKNLIDELVLAVDASISAEIDKVIKATQKELGNVTGNGFIVDVNDADVLSAVSDLFGKYAYEIERAGLAAEVAEFSADAVAKINTVIAKYEARYSEAQFPGGKLITVGKADYTSKYAYDNGDSVATDRDTYKYTDFTCDNGSVVMVTYSYTNEVGATDEVVFLLNYNNFAVDITLDGVVIPGVNTYTLGEYGCYKLNSAGAVKIK